MIKTYLAAVLATLLLTAASAAPAAAQVAPQADDRQAVLATIDGLFAAMLARDGAAVTALVEPQGIVTAITVAPDGNRIAISPWADFAARLAQAPGPIRERMFAPEVRVHGDIAMIWSRYDLSIGDTFSHCGTDLFDLIRRDGRWRLLNATFTRERTGCEPR